jgi:hypothetical protein
MLSTEDEWTTEEEIQVSKTAENSEDTCKYAGEDGAVFHCLFSNESRLFDGRLVCFKVINVVSLRDSCF